MSLYFSRLTLNRYAPTRALSGLLDPVDANARADAHHRLIWTVFGDGADRTRDFLWRADQDDRWCYVLRVNATRDRAAISRMDSAARKGKSRRVDLVMDLLRDVPQHERASVRMELAQTAATGWMARQGAAKGFVPQTTCVEDYRVLNVSRGKGRGVISVGIFMTKRSTHQDASASWQCPPICCFKRELFAMLMARRLFRKTTLFTSQFQ